MNIKQILSGFIFTIVVFTGCKKDELAKMTSENFSIKYSVGSSWVGYLYTATIDQTGQMYVTNVIELSQINEKAVYRLTDSSLSILKEKLDNLKRIDIADTYGFDMEIAPTDLPVKKMVYHTSNKSDSTSIYYPKENELPIEFEKLLGTIHKLILENDTLKQ